MRHLIHTLCGGAFFFVVVLAAMLWSDMSIQSGGGLDGVFSNHYLTNILSSVSWLGAFAGLMSSLVFRKSANQTLYVGITLVLVVGFVCAIILTL